MAYGVESMHPTVAKAHLARVCRANPQIRPWVRSRVTNAGANIVRTRPDVLYSTVGILYDGAGAPPAQIPNLFQRALGDAAPDLGGIAINEQYTNLTQPAKMDSSQQFVAHKMWFEVLPYLPTSNPNDNLQQLEDAWRAVAVTFRTGQQTDQQLGPLEMFSGGPQKVGFVAGRGVAAIDGPITSIAKIAPLQAYQAVVQMSPPITLGAGQTYFMETFVKPGMLRTIAALANSIVAIRCTLEGVSITTIDG